MGNYKKGLLSKQNLTNQARLIFNEKGINITLNELSKELGQGISSITNYYRTKDHLFVAISQNYKQEYIAIMQAFDWKSPLGIEQLVKLFSKIMDLQYDYRCALIAVIASSSSQKLLFKQITESYHDDMKQIKEFLKLFIAHGVVSNNILKKGEFEIFRFQTINLFTTWVVSKEIYDNSQTYKKMKPVYIKGILNCYVPYMTAQALEQYKAINIRKFC